MKKLKPIKLALPKEIVRTLGSAELAAVVAAEAGVVTDADPSIVYWCPNNTSIQRSCSSC